MNHGIETFLPELRNNNAESSDTGMIHSARASFTVVATFSASEP